MGGRLPMPMPARNAKPTPSDSTAARERRDALIIKLQIGAAVFGPMLLLAVWLQSQGFFGAPGS
jgi:hypothetical protein